MSEPLTSRNWFGKASAGVILGLAIAVGLSGLLVWALDVENTYFSTKGQLTMWVISPLWCGILSFCFFFTSGARAWLWLGVATALVWLVLFAVGGLS